MEKCKCIVCGYDCEYYFTKKFGLELLEFADYYRCQNCGMVVSKTHIDMSDEDWGKLNQWYHSYHGTDNTDDDKNWISRLNTQADIINIFTNHNILHNKDWVDYGCGDGKLSNTLKQKFNLDLNKFDIVPVGTGFITERELKSKKFNFVITTSVFEHLRKPEEIDNIFSLVSENGAMAIHTFISENVICDPCWFYLLPVHCAFFTNKAMKILFDRYKYSCSLYNYEGRIWFLFKNSSNIEKTINNINLTSNIKYHFKNDFMDFWK